MSRSGYSDDCDGWALIRWRGAVNAAIKGPRGQRLFQELAAAMDAMPEKVLITDALIDSDGDFCALGVVGRARGMTLDQLREVDPEESDEVAKLFDIAPALAKEIVFVNDDDNYSGTTPEARWSRMRSWVKKRIKGTS